MKEEDVVIGVGWCSYCKNEIFSDDDYTHIKEEYFHNDCLQIMNNYMDEFGKTHEYDK